MTVNTIGRLYTNKTVFFLSSQQVGNRISIHLVYYSKSEINTSTIKSFISLCQVLLFFSRLLMKTPGFRQNLRCKLLQDYTTFSYVFRTDHSLLDNQLVHQERQFLPLSFLSFLQFSVVSCRFPVVFSLSISTCCGPCSSGHVAKILCVQLLMLLGDIVSQQTPWFSGSHVFLPTLLQCSLRLRFGGCFVDVFIGNGLLKSAFWLVVVF